MGAAIAVRESTGLPFEPESKPVGRNEALDFTKGSLVLLMVFYHWFNYFVSLESEVYRYLRFLTPSFIVITGFLVSSVYLARYGSISTKTSVRLLQRGTKLLVLFTLLNLVASLIVQQNYNGAPVLGVTAFFRNAYEIYVTGNGRAAFDVLVPISYFLILAPLILLLAQWLKLSLHLVAGAALVTTTVAGVMGLSSINLELFTMALLGLSLGMLPATAFAGMLRRPVILVVAYGVYLAALTRWNVVFPVQVAGVCLSLLLIYSAGLSLGSAGAFQSQVVLLGRYSLFAYIMQVAILQLLRRLSRGNDLHAVGLAAVLLAAAAATWVSIRVLDAIRGRASTVDRLYRAVFA